MMAVVVTTAALSRILVRALSHAGIVAVAIGMIITAITLASVGVMPAQGAPFHMADPDHAAGTVTIAVLMGISAIGLTVVKMISRLRTPFHRTYADRSAGTVTITSRMVISTVSCIVMCVQPGSRTTLHRTHGTYRLIRGTCLTMMSVSRHRHNDHSGHQ